MKILVIIVSYNFERWMDRCLGSLRESGQRADIVVIDNASQDNSVRLIQENYPEVRLIQSKTNLGFGRANNIGMKIALTEGYDYVFLLNQDAWIDGSTLGTLARLCQQYPQYGIMSPTHLTGSGNKLEHGFSEYTGMKSLEEITALTTGLPTPPHCSFIYQCSFLDDTSIRIEEDRWILPVILSLWRRCGLRQPPSSCGSSDWLFKHCIWMP